ALDDKRFEPLFSRLEADGRAIWLHPTRSAAWADYPAERHSDYGLWWSLGWPYKTAAALARLVYSGHMERHPDQLVIAHHGGGRAVQRGLGGGLRGEYYASARSAGRLAAEPHLTQHQLNPLT